jgi:transcription antitermination factor NusG
MNEPCNKNWYAVHVRSNQEKGTAAFLEDRRVEHFLPTYRTRSARKDRNVTLLKPLFSGYIFVRIDHASEERLQVLQAPGCVRIVSFGKTPSTVPDEIIDSIRILTSDKDIVRPHPLIRVGRPVEVIDGPFTGAFGILSETTGKKPKLVVELEFLGRAVAVPISVDEVRAVPG